jgi:ABC-type transport system substrate-binding protein
MSRNLIRVLIMASAIAAVAVLVACGGSESPPETDSQESPTAGATPGLLGATDVPEIQVATGATPTSEATNAPAAAQDAPAPAAMSSADGGCAPSADITFTDRPPQGGTLVRLFADPTSLDPHQIGDVTSSVVVGEIFGGLVTLSLGYEPVLDLAESCSVSDDGTVYTFVLRENAKFHDGNPVTANDVKWSIERAADPTTQSVNARNYLGDIVGVNEKLEGSATEVRGVRVVDDRTVEITIDAPKAYFLAKLSYPTAFVLDRNQVTGDGSWLEQPNGTGPFRLGTYDVGELIVLERNELYHLGPPHIESVHMILSGGSAMIMYENDEIHLTGVGLDDLPRLLNPEDELHDQLKRSPQDFDVFYLGMNVNMPPFDDINVRRALNYAVDLQTIADVVLDGRVSPARGVIPPGFPSYTPNLRSYDFNPDLARELMESSSYADAWKSDSLPRITLSLSGSFGAAVPPYLEVIIEQWNQELGIQVDIQQTEWATYLEDVKDAKYQLFSIGWIADYPDPENFLDILFHSESANNNTRYSNPEVDQLLEEARTERDKTRRFQIYNQVEQMVLDEAPWVWTWFSGEGYALIKPEVSDYYLLQMSIPKYRYIYFNR